MRTTWEDALGGLVDELRGARPRDALAVGGCLLRCAAGFERELYAHVDHRSYERLRARVENDCAALFSSVDGEVFVDAHLEALELILRQALGGVEADSDARARYAVAVRAAGDALDHVLGGRFAACLIARCSGGRLALAAGDAVPLCNPPLRALMGSLSPRRSSLEPRLARLERLALVPDSPFEVVLHIDRGRALDPAMRKGRLVATGLPLGSIDDLHFDHAPGWFRNVRPRDALSAHAAAIQVLAGAAEHGASIVVLPELCLEVATCDVVHAWLRQDRKLLVVAAGSHHVHEDGGWRNRAEVYLGGRLAFAHDKNNPFKDGNRIEDIDTQPLAVTLVLSGNWSMTTVICKDLLSETLVRLLADLSVNLVLAPACSARLDDFVSPVHQLGSQAQSIVAVANIAGTRPPDGNDDDAQVSVISFPRRREKQRLLAATRSEAPAPTIVLRPLDGSGQRIIKIT